MSEQYLHYGECPKCGQSCQPDYENINNPNVEYVVCCDCRITWLLYHEDETDKRDETEPWRTYRIDNIETFEEWGGIPYECKEASE